VTRKLSVALGAVRRFTARHCSPSRAACQNGLIYSVADAPHAEHEHHR
jgi:hypothetical protein